MNNEQKMAVNAIRVLCADAIQKAKSGHPGLPLGCAAVAYELWANHMKHNPKDPEWFNRDRFILSGGHGSTLLYSLLHLFGYGLTKEDMMQFRQLGSLTPGHPEYRHTVGVEATTGPLGAGMGMAVGMAMAEAHLAEKFNKEGYPVVDHYTFVLGGDGCMMEGISSEAFSLAGTLKLNKLIVLYDSNKISIEGSTDIAFRENTQQRLESYGFQTIVVEDGNDLDAIGKAIEDAKAEKEKPSFIIVKTQIGYGAPGKMGTAAAHGEPLGDETIAAMKDFLGWPSQEPFYVPDEVYAHYKKIAESKVSDEEAWNKLFAEYCEKFPDMKKAWDDEFNLDIAKDLINCDEYWEVSEKADATRNSSGIAINRLKKYVPGMI
ncbi:MAG: transketolase, partial [Clostridia bacterium]|nr:transketolase [Clostridia bacterium]